MMIHDDIASNQSMFLQMMQSHHLQMKEVQQGLAVINNKDRIYSRLVILKSKSFLNVAYRYFQCRMMLLMRINKNFSSKLIPRVSVFSLVVLLKVE